VVRPINMVAQQVKLLEQITSGRNMALLLGSDKQLYNYANGVWRPNGEKEISVRLSEVLGELATIDVDRAVRALAYLGYPDIEVDQIDHAKDQFINVANGVVDLAPDAGPILRPHDPELRLLHQVPHDYDPRAASSTLDDYMSSMFTDGEAAFLYEVMGYCLMPNMNLKRAFLLYSQRPHTGKSTFLRLLEDLVGRENASAVDLQALDDDRFQSAHLQGKLINVCGDLTGRAATTSARFKALVGGDAISVERKGVQSYRIVNTAKMIFASNEYPATTDQTSAYFDRWWVIPFTKQHSTDSQYEARLRTREVREALLRRAAEAAHHLFHTKEFIPPISVLDATDRYADEANTVRRFVREMCFRNPGNQLVATQLYTKYKAWAEDNGHRALARPKFEARMADQEGVTVARDAGRLVFEGLGAGLDQRNGVSW